MISARNKDDIVRFYTVTDPMTHKKGYTVYKVTARIISRKNPEDIQEIHRNLYGQSELFPPFAKAKVFGGSSDSELNSLEVDGDPLAAVDDGMASGSIRHTATQSSLSLMQQPVTSPRGALSFASGLRNYSEKKDYLEEASEQINLADQKEVEQDFAVAFFYYRRDVDLLLKSVQGEESPSRREAVKRKTAEYLMRAELISGQLTDSMGQSSTQTRALGSQCCGGLWAEQTHSDELKHYRVLGIIDKGLRKSSACGHVKKTIVPHSVPNMVQLEKYIISEDSIFLLLQYAEGGKLWSHICKYLHDSSPDESFNIPFIQKAHSAAVHSTMNPMHTDSSSVDSRGLSLGENPLAAQMPDSGATSEEECTNSYLTLWNEYEQERLEPDEDCCSLAPVLTQKHTCSVLNTDRLCPPDIDAGAVLLH
ncbi:hypothetical protein cypCar_00029459 [Cyprinus carpio]|nr:hypothetical protein cypCar_00029459 [Cyprinus carpio]